MSIDCPICTCISRALKRTLWLKVTKQTSLSAAASMKEGGLKRTSSNTALSTLTEMSRLPTVNLARSMSLHICMLRPPKYGGFDEVLSARLVLSSNDGEVCIIRSQLHEMPHISHRVPPPDERPQAQSILATPTATRFESAIARALWSTMNTMERISLLEVLHAHRYDGIDESSADGRAREACLMTYFYGSFCVHPRPYDDGSKWYRAF